jgi:hypothetical protein
MELPLHKARYVLDYSKNKTSITRQEGIICDGFGRDVASSPARQERRKRN